MRAAILAAILLLACAQASAARDSNFDQAIRIRVGETKQLAVVGGYSSDCRTSLPAQVQMRRQPTRGNVSQRQDVPYSLSNSTSGECLGAPLTGTAIDYTATGPGHDAVAFDAVLPDGVAHYAFSIVNY